jgi:tRNA-(ms[2]io[6]A)-hydroxylase
MSTSENTILGLKLPTDPRWVNLAEISLEDILSDHAYCEQKAASHCISLIQKYPQHTRLVEELSPIVTEEWGHFRMVLAEIRKRKLNLGAQRKDEYVNALNQLETKGAHPDDRLLDRLLIFGLIEARSCERFRLLSEGLEDPYMKEFYRKFMISEAGHYRLFLDLAKTYCDEEKVNKRWKEFLAAEKEILSHLEIRGDRMH